MTHKSSLNSRHALESCTFHFHSWKPFQSKTLEPDPYAPKPYSTSSTVTTPPNGVIHSKRPCLSDRSTSFSIDNLDISKMNLIEDERTSRGPYKRSNFPWLARKRRRRGSRSVSGRSSDKSVTRRCCSVGASAAYATCSDFPVAAGTDSSGEFFVHNGEGSWASDVSEANKPSRKDLRDSVNGERENLGYTSWQAGVFDSQGNESGYGSEPGYRGDAEFGYGDEFDEEEDDGRLMFWDNRFGDRHMEIVGENTFSDHKAHHRCRRKKHDWRENDMRR